MHDDCMKHMEHISEFLDGELDEAGCEEIRSHLQECPQCRYCVESLKKTLGVLQHCPEESVPTDVHDRLKAALRECMSRQPGNRP